ncbi:MAG: YgjV family protein [Eubacteriales bacterium]
MFYYFVQGIGFFGTAVMFISYQMPKKSKILLFQILAAAAFSLHFALLAGYSGSYTGMVMNIIALARCVLFYFENKPFFKPKTFTALILTAIFIVGGVTYKNIFSIFPILGMTISTLCLNIKKEKWFRIFNLPGSPLWMTYNIYSRSFPGILGEIINMSSLIIAIIRYDIIGERRNKTKQAATNAKA